MNFMFKFLFLGLFLFLVGCAGMKFVNPNDPYEKNKGTVQLDVSDGKIKFVATYTCKLLNSSGIRFSATGKTEADARAEVVARCRDEAIVTFCRPEKVECQKN